MQCNPWTTLSLGCVANLSNTRRRMRKLSEYVEKDSKLSATTISMIGERWGSFTRFLKSSLGPVKFGCI
ncbi:hypothetical protein DAEQUDRAFT_728164, partial [Daedalea quercina L-15889]